MMRGILDKTPKVASTPASCLLHQSRRLCPGNSSAECRYQHASAACLSLILKSAHFGEVWLGLMISVSIQ